MEINHPTLRDYKGTTVTVECKPCRREATFDRAALVKRYGASIRFSELRRRLSLGCEKMTDVNGDRCGTRFPCLPTCNAIGSCNAETSFDLMDKWSVLTEFRSQAYGSDK